MAQQMIYLDNSATTQPCDAAIAASSQMLSSCWHNPSALYGPAIAVEKIITQSRQAVAAAAGVKPSGVVFTSSGTEADSLALLGTAARFRAKRRILFFAGEHAAVLRTQEALCAMGHTVDTIPALDDGTLDMDALAAQLTEDVALVSVMHVSNVTGAVQPLAAIASLLRAKCPDAFLHVDGVQGFLRVPIDIERAGVDLYTISAHKFHGIKGTGALLMGSRARIAAQIAGGGQEGGLRSGTENTSGIAALAAAMQWVQSQPEALERMRAIRLRLYEVLCANIDGLRVNGPDPLADTAAPHILNVSLPGVGGEVMLHALEAEGVLVGTGSACSSKKRAMSAAFSAMRAPVWAADSAIRISIGLMNTLEEADAAADAIVRCHQRYKAFQRK